MTREIKFRAEYNGRIYNVETRTPKVMRSSRYRGWHKQQGYILRLVTEHPHANKRGYVPEHRLVMEESLGRFLKPNEEFIHHVDQNRSNNELSNLKLEGGQHLHAKGHLRGSRNTHGQFLCKEPIFNELKFRLKNTDTGLTNIYTLNQLIATTWRRGCFEFRGRWTGLKDKNGKEIYEGDLLKDNKKQIGHVFWHRNSWVVEWQERDRQGHLLQDRMIDDCFGYGEIIGNIYENPDLLKGVA